MRALIKACDPFDQFKSSDANSVAIVTFKLATLSSQLAGGISLHRDDNVVKQTIVLAIPIATTDRSYSVVVLLDICSVEQPWRSFTADPLVVIVVECHGVDVTQQPPRLGAAARANAFPRPIP